MKKITVIVADDHPAFREGLARLLQQEPDIEVVATAEDGLRAVTSTRRLKPDVAVLDISMPQLNGIEAVKQIQEVCPNTAILILSAHYNPSYVKEALRAGAAGYLTKSASSYEIISAIRVIHSGAGVFNLDVIKSTLHKKADGKAKDGQEQDLHPREMEVLDMAAQGKSNKEIGSHLGISERTVERHLNNIFLKLRVNSRTQAIIKAVEKDWVTVEGLTSDEE